MLIAVENVNRNCLYFELRRPASCAVKAYFLDSKFTLCTDIEISLSSSNRKAKLALFIKAFTMTCYFINTRQQRVDKSKTFCVDDDINGKLKFKSFS